VFARGALTHEVLQRLEEPIAFVTNRYPVSRAVEDALPNHAVDRRLERKCPEQRRPKMRVSGEDRALLQSEQLVLGRLRERAVRRVGKLFVPNPSVE
jgi:hypothetical protein